MEQQEEPIIAKADKEDDYDLPFIQLDAEEFCKLVDEVLG